jgi:hypothetical protein
MTIKDGDLDSDGEVQLVSDQAASRKAEVLAQEFHGRWWITEAAICNDYVRGPND